MIGGIEMRILNVRGVKYTYQSKYQLTHALNGVNCSFAMGKFYVIEGRSGSGKTTLLSLLAGLDLPSEGEILFDNISYSEMDREQLRREKIAIVFQTFNLFPLLTVLENVMFPMQILGKSSMECKRQAIELITSVGLDTCMLNKYPKMLSGGEQQRVAIARALASGAKIILADEPTGNLDSVNANKIVRLLKSLVIEKNYCVILVTHDKNISEQADIVYHMSDGVVI